MKPLYVIHPGTVISRSDGQFHHVSAADLVRLYGLRPGEYVVYRKPQPGEPEVIYRTPRPIVHLHPDYNGVYRLPG